MTVYDEVIRLLRDRGVAYEEAVHVPVFTSEQAAQVSQHQDSEGTKSVVVEGKSGVVIVVTVGGDERIDFVRLREKLGYKVAMCKAERMRAALGVEVGAVAPFGYSSQILMLVSQKLFGQQNVYINPGCNDRTIRMSGWDFRKVMMACGSSTL